MLLRYLFAFILAPLFLSTLTFFAAVGTLGTVSALADPDPSPSPFFGVGFPSKALLGRPRSTPTTPPIYTPEPAQEFEVDILPFVLVSSIDGALHAIDRETGEIRWSLRDGVEPLVGGKVYGKHEDVEYIVEPLSGSLYIFEEDPENPGNQKLRQLPYSIQYIINNSPFRFAGGDPQSPGRMVTGSKSTSLLTLDLRTGKPIDCFSSRNPQQRRGLRDAAMCESDPLDDLEGRPMDSILYVGRTDYTLTITTPPNETDSPTGSPNKNMSVQEITYSTYTPNSYDRALADYWARTGAENWGDGKRIRVELGFNGEALGVQENVGHKWSGKLPSVGVAVYDVVLPLSPASPNPVILPQPRAPEVKKLFPSLPAYHIARLEDATRPPTAYIGSVGPALPPPEAGKTGETSDQDTQDTGVQSVKRPLLFAQSAASYPIVKIADIPPQPGKVNGTFVLSADLGVDDQLASGEKLSTLDQMQRHAREQRLIDPPSEESMRIAPPESTESQLDQLIRQQEDDRKTWWRYFIAESVAVCVLVVGVYRWAFSKATKAAAGAAEKVVSETTPLLSPPTEDEKKITTPVVRFEALPEVNGTSDPNTPPKKKSTRRRVRGRKKRRNSVGPELDRDEGDGAESNNDDITDAASPTPSEERASSGSNGSNSATKSDSKPEDKVVTLPRSTSSVSLNDELERLVISDTVIGFGSHGTVVLKGTWGGRPVAVKRLLSDFVRLASQEVKLLQASDDHPNVIRYYCQERRDNFLYIALDLCQASLADLIESPDRHMDLGVALNHKKALQQITAGLKHLHAMKIIHRDIKPQNVLVSKAKDGSLRMLVSDFGLARRLEQGQSSFAPTANNLAGSLGWRAPECIRGQVKLNEGFDPVLSCCSSGSTASSTGSLVDLTEVDSEGKKIPSSRARLTKAVDLFALGCLYFWVLMNGEHPFGETYNRESNIVKGDAVNMEQLKILGEEGVEAMDLIGQLLSLEPSERPDTHDCLIHPFFWTPAKRLAFLCDASDRFEIMETDPPESTLVMLETDAQAVVGKDWYSRMDKVFTSSLGKYRKYKGHTVRDLLRAMRNKKHHYQDLEPSAQRHFGALPAGFLHYFTSRFPKLFLHVYGVVKESRLRHEPMFDGYFQES